MRIVRNKYTYRVDYLFEDADEINLTPSMLMQPMHSFTVNSETHEAVFDIPSPPFWEPGYYYYYDTDWDIYSEDLYDTTISGELDGLKFTKYRQIEALRYEKFYSSVQATFPDGVGYIQFRGELDRANLANVATAALSYMAVDPNANMVYRTEDNVTHNVTASGMAAIAMNVMAQKQAIVSAAWAHKDAVDTLTTVSGVTNYDINTGWPI